MPATRLTFRPITRHNNATTAALLSQINLNQKLLIDVCNALPQHLATQVNYCIIRKNQLLIYTTAAVWASQLRFYSDNIRLSVSQKAGIAINSVRVRLLFPLSQQEPIRRKPKLPSRENIALLSKIRDPQLPDELTKALNSLHVTLKRLADKT